MIRRGLTFIVVCVILFIGLRLFDVAGLLILVWFAVLLATHGVILAG